MIGSTRLDFGARHALAVRLALVYSAFQRANVPLLRLHLSQSHFIWLTGEGTEPFVLLTKKLSASLVRSSHLPSPHSIY
jgi:hypothetical protein